MLVGHYYNSIDEKGRLLIPSKFRNEIEGGTVVVAPGIERCLRVFTLAQWNVVVKEIMGSGSMFQRETRELVRTLISPAFECEIDKAGRILVPANLREKVGLSRDVYVIGAVEYLELWDPTEFDGETNGVETQVAEIAEKIGNHYAEKKKMEG